jgi:hypothetical protein
MTTCVFTPPHETGILLAHIIPYARGHDIRLGRESSWPHAPSGIHFFRPLMVKGVFYALTGRAAFLFRGNVELIDVRWNEGGLHGSSVPQGRRYLKWLLPNHTLSKRNQARILPRWSAGYSRVALVRSASIWGSKRWNSTGLAW